MMQLLRIAALGTLSILLFAQLFETKDKPSIRISARTPAAIVVEASDAEGLDSFDISCQQADSTYHTQLSRSAVDHQFKRSFTLRELFPSLAEGTAAVRLEVTVRNTRGATASAAILVPPTHPNKGN
jgi:hypothetical protein